LRIRINVWSTWNNNNDDDDGEVNDDDDVYDHDVYDYDDHDVYDYDDHDVHDHDDHDDRKHHDHDDAVEVAVLWYSSNIYLPNMRKIACIWSMSEYPLNKTSFVDISR